MEENITSGGTVINVNTTQRNGWKVGSIIAIAILLFGVGFFVGRKTIKQPIDKPPIYIPGDTIKQEVPVPYPVEVIVPAEVDTGDLIKYCVDNDLFTDLLPVKDSLIYLNPQTKDDSLKIYMAIAKDWVKERAYFQTLFDEDTLGKCTVDIKVSNNQLKYLDYTFVPVIKQVEVDNFYTHKFSPFIGGGLTTMPTIVAQGGMFFDDKYGFSYLYQYDYVNKNHIHGGTFLIKF